MSGNKKKKGKKGVPLDDELIHQVQEQIRGAFAAIFLRGSEIAEKLWYEKSEILLGYEDLLDAETDLRKTEPGPSLNKRFGGINQRILDAVTKLVEPQKQFEQNYKEVLEDELALCTYYNKISLGKSEEMQNLVDVHIDSDDIKAHMSEVFFMDKLESLVRRCKQKQDLTQAGIVTRLAEFKDLVRQQFASPELRKQVEMQLRAEMDAIFMTLTMKLDKIHDEQVAILGKYKELMKDEYKIEKMDEEEMIDKEIKRLSRKLTAACKDLVETQKATQALWIEALKEVESLVANFDIQFYPKMVKWGEDCEEFEWTDKLMRATLKIATSRVQYEKRVCIDLQVNRLKLKLAENMVQEDILTMLQNFKSAVHDHVYDKRFEWDAGQCGCCWELSFSPEKTSSMTSSPPPPVKKRNKKGHKE